MKQKKALARPPCHTSSLLSTLSPPAASPPSNHAHHPRRRPPGPHGRRPPRRPSRRRPRRRHGPGRPEDPPRVRHRRGQGDLRRRLLLRVRGRLGHGASVLCERTMSTPAHARECSGACRRGRAACFPRFFRALAPFYFLGPGECVCFFSRARRPCALPMRTSASRAGASRTLASAKDGWAAPLGAGLPSDALPPAAWPKKGAGPRRWALPPFPGARLAGLGLASRRPPTPGGRARHPGVHCWGWEGRSWRRRRALGERRDPPTPPSAVSPIPAAGMRPALVSNSALLPLSSRARPPPHASLPTPTSHHRSRRSPPRSPTRRLTSRRRTPWR